MAANVAVTIKGGPELRAAFREIGGKGALNVLKEAQRPIATRATEFSRGFAASGSKMERRNAYVIEPYLTLRGAGVQVKNSEDYPSAIAAFLGIDRRTGWFAQSKYNGYNAADQGFAPYRGSSGWRAGVPGEGPRDLNEGVAATVDFAIETYGDGLRRAANEVGIPFTD